jgi:ethanolamine utilization protein EutA
MTNEADKKRRHTLADHLYGTDHDHRHDDDAHDHDHDHDHDLGPAGPLEENAIWAQDNISLTSVGIDIGSAGTQVIFSRLRMRRLGEDLSSRYFVVARETVYESPVALTPYVSEERIDEQAIGRIVDDAYTAAGVHPDDIDTGSVILTGEALRRENAQAIGELLAEIGGEFVCASAGHHMEAMLAAYGSGAAKVSHDRGAHVLNIDIGGGTTKLAVIEHGRVEQTGAIHIGGRLLVVDDEYRITRLDPAGQYLAGQTGFEWRVGDVVSPSALDTVAEWMAHALLRALLDRPSPEPIERLYLTAPLADGLHIDGVMFSGGVAEYVYDREQRDFGDLGRRLGRALRTRIDAGALPWPVLPAGECIRATAFGASEYSVQLSGNTVYISEPGALLPRRNLQVLQPPVRLDRGIDPDGLAAAIARHFEAFDVAEGESEVALAFRWRGEPSFERLEAFASAIVTALRRTIEQRRPIYLVLDGDVAQTIGAILKEDWRIASEVLVIDGITLRDFDYIDLGRIRMPSYTVPVTIKSLLFVQDPRAPHSHQQGHAQAHSHAPRPRHR